MVRLSIKSVLGGPLLLAVVPFALTALTGCNPGGETAKPQLTKVAAGPLRVHAGNAMEGKQTPIEVAAIEVLTAHSEKVPESLETLAIERREPSGRLIVVKNFPLARMRELLADRSVLGVDEHRPYVVWPQPVWSAKASTRIPGTHTLSGPPEVHPGLSKFASEHPGVDGSSVLVAVLDDGAVKAPHVEFGVGRRAPPPSRVQIVDGATFSNHATEMAGLVGAFGIEPAARGMAPNVRMLSYDMRREIAALTDARQRGAMISNHSYGPPAGWHPREGQWVWYGGEDADEDMLFGKYGLRIAELDNALWHTQLLAFAAAGNDAGTFGKGPNPVACGPGSSELCCPHQVALSGNQFKRSNRCRPPDGGASRSDTLSGPCVAKNTICLTLATPLSGMSGAWAVGDGGIGPTDDYRIKPDLAGPRDLATAPSASQSYARTGGTSAASAVGAGAAALLTDLFQRTRSRQPSAAEMKAILIHTAMPPSNFPRVPNVRIGWGILDLVAAGRAIARTSEYIIESSAVTAGGRIVKTLRATQADVRATLVWLDKCGPPNRGGIDDRAGSLVNDLDMKIQSGSATFWPYRLAGDPPLARADEPNRTDPVERIDVQTAAGSGLTLTITGFRVTGTQPFAIVISGASLN